MTTSMRTLRNAVLLAVGVMLALVLVYQDQAWAGYARTPATESGCLSPCSGTSGSTSGGTTTSTTYTPTAPYVTQVNPQDGATGVPRNTNIKITFSEPMDPATINTSTVQLHFADALCIDRSNPCYYSSELISATVSKDTADTSGLTYVLDPYGSGGSILYSNKRYRVSITTGVKDSNDGLNMASNKDSYFTTGSW